jgi:hypothetical protein
MMDNIAPTYCANHPDVETSLRCNKCGKPICAKCAIRTPTGYRCKECVRGQQKIFETAHWVDFALGFLAAGILSFLASLLVGLISGIAGIFAWLIIVAVSPTAGMGIAEAIRFVTRKHRSRSLFITVVIAVILGGLPAIIFNLVAFNIFGLIFQAIFLFVATPIIYTRMAGIQLSR